MTSLEFDFEAFRDLLEGASVLGRLAQNENAFRSAYTAFRANSSGEFQEVLKRFGLFSRCGLVCEWIRNEECAFLDLDLCGAPKRIDQVPNIRVLTEAIVRVTSDDEVVSKLVDAFEQRTRDVFRRVVTHYKIRLLSHFLCHWLYTVRHRMICRWAGGPLQSEQPNLANKLQSAGQSLRRLLADKRSFELAVAAVTARDAAKLQSAAKRTDLDGLCPFICEWFCSWRCSLTCLTLCREFPVDPINNELEEALALARATRQFEFNPSAVQRLTAAVAGADRKAWTAALAELQLQRFCFLLCHWVSNLLCRRLCVVASGSIVHQSRLICNDNVGINAVGVISEKFMRIADRR